MLVVRRLPRLTAKAATMRQISSTSIAFEVSKTNNNTTANQKPASATVGGGRNRRVTASPASQSPIVMNLKKLNEADQCISYYTETVRYNKAIRCLWEDKIRNEFPQLKEYAIQYEPRDKNVQILEFEQYGLVYPGADDRPDPAIHRACRMSVKVDKLLPFLSGQRLLDGSESHASGSIDKEQLDKAHKKFLLLCGDDYNPITGRLTIQTDRFPAYGENKKWLVDTLANLVHAARDLKSETFDSLPNPQAAQAEELANNFHADGRRRLRFPEKWKRKDMAGKVAAAIHE